jgi:hypothetical protein
LTASVTFKLDDSDRSGALLRSEKHTHLPVRKLLARR